MLAVRQVALCVHGMLHRSNHAMNVPRVARLLENFGRSFRGETPHFEAKDENRAYRTKINWGHFGARKT